MYTFFEFFAGGGMARAGLGEGWECRFANDFSPTKAAAYRANWGDDIMCCDVAAVSPEALVGHANLVWASFPCQDLSLAGRAAGIGRAQDTTRTRSGSFWPFWQLMQSLSGEGRSADIIVLENVVGLLNANRGANFLALAEALTKAGYNFGAVVIDACDFVPQSRPRVFVVAINERLAIPLDLIDPAPSIQCGSLLGKAYWRLPAALQRRWISWRLPAPPKRIERLCDVVDVETSDVPWDTPTATEALISSMSPVQLAKVHAAIASSGRQVGAVFNRTRVNSDGDRRVFAEVRFDDIAGCVRPPGGGSSRQRVIVVDGAVIRSRLLSPREIARLMGLSEQYVLPERRNEAYQLLGDGVVVPVVSHLSKGILEPILHAQDLVGLADVWAHNDRLSGPPNRRPNRIRR